MGMEGIKEFECALSPEGKWCGVAQVGGWELVDQEELNELNGMSPEEVIEFFKEQGEDVIATTCEFS